MHRHFTVACIRKTEWWHLRLRKDRTGSFYNRLTRGCELCAMGAKLVLFTGGQCQRDCWYCPVSVERRVDTAYANERILRSKDDLLAEAGDQGALGTGVTGGEPLLYIKRVEKYVTLLKQNFGKEHHVHLYSGQAPSNGQLTRLLKAGVDELRLHPPLKDWGHFLKTRYPASLLNARNLGIDAGLEIPAIQPVGQLLEFCEEHDCFLILDELEFSEANATALKNEGYFLDPGSLSAVKGSARIGRDTVSRAACRARFCSSMFKDVTQLRERFRRTASRVRRPYQNTTRDGLLVYGVVSGDEMSEWVRLRYRAEMYEVMENGDVYVSVATAKKIKKLLGKKCQASIVSRHPVVNGMVVEKTFL